MKAIAIIPARGGSKRLPRKNLAKLGEWSLVEWAIECALQAKSVSAVVVTSDDDEILKLARNSGIFAYSRSARLATDDALVGDAVNDAVNCYGKTQVDAVVTLYPSHPFRSPLMIDECMELLENHNHVHTMIPVYGENKELLYATSGLVLVSRTNLKPELGSYYLSLNCKHTQVDIDTQFDLDCANELWKAAPWTPMNKTPAVNVFSHDKPKYKRCWSGDHCKMRPA